MMRDLGLIDRLPRIVVAQAERANPLYRSYLKNFASFEPMQAQKNVRQRDPDRQPRKYREGDQDIEAVRRHRHGCH